MMAGINMDITEHNEATADWYYLVMGEVHGPITRDELNTLALSNNIGRDSFVRQAGSEWMLADHVGGLFPELALRRGIPKASKDDLYYQVMGEVHGPVSAKDLKALVASSNGIARDTLVRQNGNDWVTIDCMALLPE